MKGYIIMKNHLGAIKNIASQTLPRLAFKFGTFVQKIMLCTLMEPTSNPYGTGSEVNGTQNSGWSLFLRDALLVFICQSIQGQKIYFKNFFHKSM